jgi:hypothetical protein
MALVEDSMVTIRLQFNERFLFLRDLKKQIVFTIRRDNARIRAIDLELGRAEESSEGALWEPHLNPIEFPDDRDEVTPSELEEYIKAREALPWAKIQPAAHSVITGAKTHIQKLSNGSVDTRQQLPDNKLSFVVDPNAKFLSSENPLEMATEVDVADAQTRKHFSIQDNVLSAFRSSNRTPDAIARIAEIEKTVPILRLVGNSRNKKMLFQNPTEAQEAARAERRQGLEFERKMLLQQMEENVNGFDEAVEELRFVLLFSLYFLSSFIFLATL